MVILTELTCYTKPGDNPENWKIALAESAVPKVVKWFHIVLGHPGASRLIDATNIGIITL